MSAFCTQTTAQANLCSSPPLRSSILRSLTTSKSAGETTQSRPIQQQQHGDIISQPLHKCSPLEIVAYQTPCRYCLAPSVHPSGPTWPAQCPTRTIQQPHSLESNYNSARIQRLTLTALGIWSTYCGLMQAWREEGQAEHYIMAKLTS